MSAATLVLKQTSLFRGVAYHYIGRVVAYHCFQAFLVLGRPSFFKPSGAWQSISSLPGSAGPSDIHASWGSNRKCASLGESRTKILEFHQWGGSERRTALAWPPGMGILRLRLRVAFYNFKALTPQSQHTTKIVFSCRASSNL